MQIWPGQPFPLGATFDGVGTNFSLFSEVAERVELCLFDANGKETRVDLPEMTALCWHGYLPNVRPGQHYGFRVHGPWAPDEGLWCNPAKLLMDPYAKALDGLWNGNEAIFPYHFADPDNSRNDLDSAPFVPKSVVINPFFDWGSDRRPEHAMAQDGRVRDAREGLHADASGYSAGICAAPTRAWRIRLRSITSSELGVTAVELLPVHQFVQDSSLADRGLRNYWGYNSIGYLAPHNEYARAGRAANRSRNSSTSSGRCTGQGSR